MEESYKTGFIFGSTLHTLRPPTPSVGLRVLRRRPAFAKDNISLVVDGRAQALRDIL